MKDIGPFIKEILLIKRVDQKELAKAIGISEQQMGQLLKVGAEKWKLIYFEKACKYLHIHPKSFFDDWPEPSTSISGNVENSSFLGNSNISMFNNSDSSLLIDELRERLKDKEKIIDSLTEIINMQRAFIETKCNDKQIV